MSDKATPRPWEALPAKTQDGEETISIRGDGAWIATMDVVAIGNGPYRLPEHNIANAALIVRAVNSFDALVEACKAASAIMPHAPGCIGDPPCAACKCIDQLDAALAAAEVTP